MGNATRRTVSRKKKIEDELTLYHEKHFRGNPNYNASKIKHLLGQLDVIIGDATKDELTKHEHEMLRLSVPELWNVYEKNNAELQHEIGFEQFMFLVQEHTKEDLKKIETTRFYSLLNYIEDKNKQNG